MTHTHTKTVSRMSYDCYGQVPESEASTIIAELNHLTMSTWTSSTIPIFKAFDKNDVIETLEPGNVWIITNIVMENN